MLSPCLFLIYVKSADWPERLRPDSTLASRSSAAPDKNVKSPSFIIIFYCESKTLNVCSASDGVWGTGVETRILRLFIVQ